MTAQVFITARATQFQQARLVPEMAVRWAILELIMLLNGLSPGRITTAFRSLEYQRELKRRHDAREPGISPVARRSWHTVGQAIDASFPGDQAATAGYL